MKKLVLLALLFVLTSCCGGGGSGPASVRFVDNGNGTIYDKASLLTWLKDANCFGKKNWEDSIAAAKKLASSQCGLTDGSDKGSWRLPTVYELRAFTDSGYRYNTMTSEGFSNVMSDFDYWSSTTRSSGTSEAEAMSDFDDLSPTTRSSTTSEVWSVFLLDGAVGSGNKINLGYTWPVRD